MYQGVNVGSGRPASVLDIARVLSKLYGKELSLQVENTYRAGDVRHYFADISRAEELLGYQPLVPLEDGLREFV